MLGGAHVLLWAPIDQTVTPTGFCTHLNHGGQSIEPAAALAVCVPPEEPPQYYLFHCDPSWRVLADTWHETLELAQRQAEAEYRGVSALWRPRA
jgi:hypothetical protein